MTTAAPNWPVDSRDRYLALVGLVVARLGADVPEDPGAGELADLLDEASAGLLAVGEAPRSAAGSRLGAAGEHLRATVRLQGSMPLVALWHFRTAAELAQDAQLLLGSDLAAPR